MKNSKQADSFIYKLPVGFKFASLFIISIILVNLSNIYIQAFICFLTILLYILSGFSYKKIIQQFSAIWLFLLILCIVQYFSLGLNAMIVFILRFVTLILFAALISLTSSFSAIMDFFEKIFSFLRYFSINPAKISLAIALTLRFIPLFQQIVTEVREAQKTRGLENHYFAIVMPVLIRCLKMTDDVANAIIARCYELRK